MGNARAGHLKPGFTLIELLVVVSIIALLAALVIPAIAMMVEATKTTKCLSNQRQIALALLVYSEDWEGRLPRIASGFAWGGGGGTGPYANWTMSLLSYGVLNGGDVGALYCPSEPVPQSTIRPQIAPNIYPSSAVRSYSANGAVDDPAIYPTATDLIMSGPYAGIRTSRPLGNLVRSVSAPYRCFLTAEIANGGISNGNNLGCNNDITWATWRHKRNTGSTFSFVDGHAKVIGIQFRASTAQVGLPKYLASYTVDSANANLIDPQRY